MRWLAIKDLQVLRRSPLLLALLVIYPVVISVLIGLALSRGPDKPRIAFVNLVAPGTSTIVLGGERIDLARYSARLFETVEPVRVGSRAKAVEMVRSGEVLGALIIPADIATKVQTGLESPRVEVIYNAEDPIKGRYVEQVINSQLADANLALSGELKEIIIGDIDLLLEGGTISLFGREVEVLGLQATKRILDRALASLPADAPERAALRRVAQFAQLAVSNLNLADDVVATLSQPVRVRRTALQGARIPLSSFAVALAVTVSLMFVTVLLAAGMLALEREENTFARLVRGLVSRSALLVEKVGLAAALATASTLAMLCGLGLFVALDWARLPLWLAALAAGALAFASMGAAIGALAREVRVASLLAFLLTLPVAFLALVPSGGVSDGLYTVVGVVSAAFPFKPALQAIGEALSGGGSGMVGPVAHLLGLTVGFGVLARVALARFA